MARFLVLSAAGKIANASARSSGLTGDHLRFAVSVEFVDGKPIVVRQLPYRKAGEMNWTAPTQISPAEVDLVAVYKVANGEAGKAVEIEKVLETVNKLLKSIHSSFQMDRPQCDNESIVLQNSGLVLLTHRYIQLT